MKLTKSKLKEIIREEIQKLNESINEARLKRGSKITYMRQFAFGKKGKETARVMAIRGNDVLLDNGQELDKRHIKFKPKDYKIESVNEAYGDLNDDGFKKVEKYNKIAIKLVKKLENAVRHSEGKDAVKWIKGLYDATGIMYDTIGHKMYYESINEAMRFDIKDLINNPKVKKIMKRLGIRGGDAKSAAKIVQYFMKNPSALKAIGA